MVQATVPRWPAPSGSVPRSRRCDSSGTTSHSPCRGSNGGRRLLEESEPGSLPLNDPYTRVAPAAVDRRSLPETCSPPEWSSSRATRKTGVKAEGGWSGCSFHGKREGRVGIVGRLRLVDTDIGQHGRASAVAMRLARDLRTRHAEVGGGRRARDSGELRQRRRRAPRRRHPAFPTSPSQRQLS